MLWGEGVLRSPHAVRYIQFDSMPTSTGYRRYAVSESLLWELKERRVTRGEK